MIPIAKRERIIGLCLTVTICPTWQDLLRMSSGREGNSIYRISPANVQRIEMETVNRYAPAHSADVFGGEILPRKAVNHERHFWREMRDPYPDGIGASKGQTTTLIYIVYHFDGTVHGYPITRQELDSVLRDSEEET